MTVPCEKFMFDISHKGGIGETRDTKLDITHLKQEMVKYKDQVYNINGGKVCLI